MSVKRIQLSRTEQSENVLTALRLLREARDRSRHVRLVIEQSGAVPPEGEPGNPEDYDAMKAVFGVPEEGSAQELFALLLAVDGAINSPAVDEAIGRLG
jgi:hypothetical protein